MTDHPYRAPQTGDVVSEPPPNWPRFRRWSFVVNSVVAVVVLLGTAFNVTLQLLPPSTFRSDHVVPTVLLVIGVMAYLMGEWRVSTRGVRWIERLLGVGNGLLALYVAGAGVVVTWNLIIKPSNALMKLGILAGVIGWAGVASWLGTCACYRLRRRQSVAAGELSGTDES